MKVEKYVSNRFIIILSAIVLIIAVIVAYFHFKSRFDAAAESKYYTLTQGEIWDYGSFAYEDEDDDTYYKYSVILNYEADGQQYQIETDDNYEDQPVIGHHMNVMYRTTNPSDAYVAHKDNLTGKYIPDTKGNNMMIFFIVFLLSFDIILLATVIPFKGRGAGIMLGIGLLMIGVSGVYVAIVEHVFAMWLMLIFGAVGLLALYQSLFKDPKKLEQQTTASENQRLVIVRGIDDLDNYMKQILFAVATQTGTEMYLAYTTSANVPFAVGDKYQFDKGLVDVNQPMIDVHGCSAYDISFLPIEVFRPLNRVFKMLFSSVH